MKRKTSKMEGGIVCDEIEIRPGFSYLEYAGMIIGTKERPILEKNVSEVRTKEIPSKQWRIVILNALFVPMFYLPIVV